MQFEIKNNKSINDVMRTIGYQPAHFSGYARSRVAGQNEDEFSIVRQVSGNDYPRFHLYIKEGNGKFIFNLHLDQKSRHMKAQEDIVENMMVKYLKEKQKGLKVY